MGEGGKSPSQGPPCVARTSGQKTGGISTIATTGRESGPAGSCRSASEGCSRSAQDTVASRYKHALCLHPYYRDSHAGSLGLAVFPPTGLEYIASALKGCVKQVTLVDLRLPGPMRKLQTLTKFIADEIDFLCISINWEYHFAEVCNLVNSLPQRAFTVVAGKQATDFVE